jgi:hypothetical protein
MKKWSTTNGTGFTFESSSPDDSRHSKVQGVERKVKDQNAKSAEIVSYGTRLGDSEGSPQLCMSSYDW